MSKSLRKSPANRKALHLLVVVIACTLLLNCGGGNAPRAETEADATPVQESADFPRDKVVLQTEDDVTIYGTLVYIADGNPHPAAVLCHQFKRDRNTYSAFQTLLAENGIGSIAIDFRGFGESTDDGLSFAGFKNQDYIDMLKDIKAAVKFLVDGPERNEFNTQRIGLVGASIGANLAIMAGAELDGLKCTAALSPGRSWHGLEPLPHAPDVTIPAFIAYAKGDGQSAEVIPDLTAAFGDNEPEVVALDGRKHGTDMLAEGLDGILLTWLKEQLAE